MSKKTPDAVRFRFSNSNIPYGIWVNVKITDFEPDVVDTDNMDVWCISTTH